MRPCSPVPRLSMPTDFMVARLRCHRLRAAALTSSGSRARLRRAHLAAPPGSRWGPPRFGLVPRPTRTPTTHLSCPARWGCRPVGVSRHW